MKNILMAIFFALGFSTLAIAQQASVSNRPTEVKVVLSGDKSETWKGAFSGHAVARYCGQTDPMYFGTKHFGLEYPLDPPTVDDGIDDIRFESNELVDGVKTTTKFHVSVTVHSPDIGSPHAYVVDSESDQKTGSGDASLTVKGNELTVSVRAAQPEPIGAKLELVFTCHAPKK
jgi:hypothetical protein